jgi:transcriptional regulator with XRE-family HTH domain
MNNEEYWNRVKELLAKNNMKQTELAEKTNVSIGVLKNWIYRNILPDAEQAQLIAQALHTSVEYLVTGSENTDRAPTLAAEIRSVLDKYK